MSVQLTTRRFALLLCQTTSVSSKCRTTFGHHTISKILQVLPESSLKRHATCASVAICKTNPASSTWGEFQVALDEEAMTRHHLFNYSSHCRESSPCEVDFTENSLTVSSQSIAALTCELDNRAISEIELGYIRDVTERARPTDFIGRSHVFLTSCSEMDYMRVSDGAKLSTETGSSKSDKKDQPNADLLNNVKNFMIETIPSIMSKQHEYRIYTNDLVFENNWAIDKPYTVVGLTAYALRLLKARVYIHFKYAKVKVTVLDATVDSSASTVVVRWRIAGLPQIKAFMFWKYVPFQVKSKGREESEWLDGVSTFYVNNKGFIRKHRLDRVIVDKDFAKNVAKVVVKPALGMQGS